MAQLNDYREHYNKMTQQKFTDVLVEFLDARDNLAHLEPWQTGSQELSYRLTKAGEKLNAMVQPGAALQPIMQEGYVRLTTERTSSSHSPKTHPVMLPRELPELTKEDWIEVCVLQDKRGLDFALSEETARKFYSRIVEKFGV